MHAVFLSAALALALLASPLAVPFASPACADVRDELRAILAQDPATVDLARAKLELDRLVDPGVDVEAELARIDAMAAAVRAMLPLGSEADAWAKVEALRRFIYEPGPWNEGQAFAYDMADPLGQEPANRRLADYLADRQGNCVTMPILFVVLGQRLGLDVTLAQAPLHLLVKLTDDEGQVWNLEATSGALPARDAYYRERLPITDRAVEAGLYLRPLGQEEAVAVMAEVVLGDLIEHSRYMDAMAAADLMAEHAPLDAYAVLKKGHAAALMIQGELERYGGPDAVPEDAIPLLNYLGRVNADAFAQAEAMGWVPFDPAAATTVAAAEAPG
jgi:regulator of sirC expression with transglutaminase-like and TPR domain